MIAKVFVVERSVIKKDSQQLSNQLANQYGGAIVEFAIIFPLITALIFAGFDISMALIDKANINHLAERSLQAINRDCNPEENQALDIFRENLSRAKIDPSKLDQLINRLNFNYSPSTKILSVEFPYNYSCYFCGLTFGLADKLNQEKILKYQTYVTNNSFECENFFN